MKWFLISPFTINVLNASILLAFMIYFLLKGNSKSRATLFLITFLTGVTIVFISFVVIFSSVDPTYSTIAWLALHLFVFASIFMVQFAYNFPENLHPRESRIVLVICTIASSVVYPYYVYKTFTMEPLYSFEGSLFVFFNTPEIGIVIGLEILWVLLLFLRKAALLSDYKYDGIMNRWTGESDSSGKPKGLITLSTHFCIACIKIFKARARSATAIRNLFLIFISPVLLISAIVMAYQGFLSWEVVAHILGSGFMAVIFLFIVLYINNSSEPSTFLIKLIGISLGTTLIIFGLLSNIALMIRDEEYDKKRLIEVSQCKKALSEKNLSHIPANVAYLLSRPLGEGPDSISNKVEFVRDANFSLRKVIENKVAELPSVKTGFMTEDMPEMTRLYRKIGRLDVNDYYSHYDFLMGGRLYEVGYPYIEYRKVIHETGLKLICIIMGAVLFIIIIFPLFFRESLIKPLDRLLDGVRKVNKGDLGVVVPVHVEDEIGFLSGSFNNMVRSILESEEKLKDNLDFQVKLTESYSYFVPREFLEFLQKKSIIDIKLGDNVQKEMTILFSDIRSFTMLSEKMTPQENFNFLNSCLSRIGPVVRNNGGFIDKYIGDAVMALFPNSAEDALHAAVAMQNVVRTYNKHRKSAGYEPIDVGVGIHTGVLMLGTIGEEKRMEGTVISDAVNLASRLEGLTKMYGVPIIISDHTASVIKDRSDFHSRYLGRVQVKGKKKWVDIFELLDGVLSELVDLKLETKMDFEQGIHLYQNSRFTEAGKTFDEVLKKNPEDRAASLYIKRCRTFEKSGIPEDWQGVTIFDKK